MQMELASPKEFLHKRCGEETPSMLPAPTANADSLTGVYELRKTEYFTKKKKNPDR
jgi:hypothetical protein